MKHHIVVTIEISSDHFTHSEEAFHTNTQLHPLTTPDPSTGPSHIPEAMPIWQLWSAMTVSSSSLLL